MADDRLRSSLSTKVILTSEAFSQFIELIFAPFIGQSFQLKRATIHVAELNLKEVTLAGDRVEQTVFASVLVDQPGWTGYRANVPLLVNCAYQFDQENNFPCIRLKNLKINTTNRIDVRVARIRIKNNRLDNWVIRAIEKRQTIIEKQINRQIATQCEQRLNEYYPISRRNKAQVLDRCVSFESLQWHLSHADKQIVLLLTTLFQITNKKNRSRKCTWTYQPSLKLQEAHFIRTQISAEEVEKLFARLKLPKKPFGNSRIIKTKLTETDPSSGHVNLQVAGDMEAGVHLAVRVAQGNYPKLKIEQIHVDLSNKLLDFGIHLFENQLAKTIQDRINESIQAQYHLLIAQIDQARKNLQPDIALDGGESFAEGELRCSLEFVENGLLVGITSRRPKLIRVNRLPKRQKMPGV